MASQDPTPPAVLDHEAIAGALRALGMLYGAKQPLATTAAGAADEAEVIRAYLERERPHLLKCYDLETLVQLVRSAREGGAEAGASFEQFGPG
jgi:hypothetical protein